MYTTDAEASNAIRMFNNYMIRPSWQLGTFFDNIHTITTFNFSLNLIYILTKLCTIYKF